MYPIPVLEYKQMSGRAGRPQFDEYGEAILIASNSDEQDALFEDYILATPERIYSRLAQESAIRGHTLAAIASDYAHTEEGLIDFFGGTFYGYHYPSSNIRNILKNLLNYLLREDMILYKKGYLYATKFGRRVSELYIDPLTAIIIRDGLTRRASKVTDFSWLHLICHTPDMRPILRPRRNDYDLVESHIDIHKDEFTIPVPENYDYIDYEQFLGEVKTAIILEAWMNERSESDLLEVYNVQPGDRYSTVHNAQWLLYSAHELANVLDIKDYITHIRRVRERIRHGVKNELLQLVRLNGIGRIRARVLYNNGFTSKQILKRAPIQRLVEIPLIGSRLAKVIKEQVGGSVDEIEWKNLITTTQEQRSIRDFVEEEFEQ
jgi:helicase